MSTHVHEYRLRNHPDRCFRVEAASHTPATGGALVRALVTAPEGQSFRYELVFEGDFVATKANLDAEAWLHTALSLVEGQIESGVHRDTRFRTLRTSGLTRTEPGATLDWKTVD